MSKMIRLMISIHTGFRLWFALLAPAVVAGCCVTPPTAEEILNLGFRTPEMTFRTFQAGVRGDLPLLEYRCFSVDYRSRNRLSQLTYREFRERELASSPWFQKGVADAKILASESLEEGRHLLRVGSHGHELEVVFVREDFWQLWSNADRLVDQPLPRGGFSDSADILVNDPPLVVASAELTPDLVDRPLEELREQFTEFRVGREWKIDHIEQPADPPGL